MGYTSIFIFSCYQVGFVLNQFANHLRPSIIYTALSFKGWWGVPACVPPGPRGPGGGAGRTSPVSSGRSARGLYDALIMKLSLAWGVLHTSAPIPALLITAPSLLLAHADFHISPSSFSTASEITRFLSSWLRSTSEGLFLVLNQLSPNIS